MIARPSVLVFINSAIGALLGYAAIILMARYMGAELVGARAYTLSIVLLGSLLTRLGLPITHARRLAQGEDVGSSNGTFIALKVILTTAFLGLGYLGLWVWLGVLGKPFEDTTELAMLLGIWIVVAKSLRGIAVNTFRGLGHFVQREAVLFVNTVVTVLASGWVAIAYAVGEGRWLPFPGLGQWLADALGVTGPMSFETALTALLGAYLLGELASLIFGWALFLWDRTPVARPTVPVARDYMKQAIPLMMVNIAAITMANMDQIFIGFWWSATEGGYYDVSNKLSKLMLILASSINIVLMPYFAKQFKDAPIERIRKSTAQVERFISILAVPLAVFSFVVAGPMIHILLADDFLPAIWVLRVLLVVALIQSFTVPVRAKAIGKGESRLAARTTWGALGLNLVLDLLLIPKQLGPIPMAGLGPLGAAVATLFAAGAMLVTYRLYAHRWTGHPLLPTYVVKHTAAAGLLGAALWLALPILPGVLRFYHLALFGLLFFVAYLGILVALKEFGRKDWQAIKQWRKRSHD